MIDLKIEVLTEDEQAQINRLENAYKQADKKVKDYYNENAQNFMDALNEVKPPSIFGEKTEPYYTLDDFEEGEELSKDREKKRKEYQDFMDQLDRYEIRERYKANILMQDDEVEALRNDFIRVINSVTRKDYNEWKAKLKDTTNEQDGELMTLCLYEYVRLPFMTALTRRELETKDEVLKDRYDKLLTEIRTKIIPKKINELTGMSKKIAKDISVKTYKEKVVTYSSPAVNELLYPAPNNNKSEILRDDYGQMYIKGENAWLVQKEGQIISTQAMSLLKYANYLYKQAGEKTITFSLLDYVNECYSEEKAKELTITEDMTKDEREKIYKKTNEYLSEVINKLNLLYECSITYTNPKNKDGKSKRRAKNMKESRIIQNKAVKDGKYISFTLSDEYQKHLDSVPKATIYKSSFRIANNEGAITYKISEKLQDYMQMTLKNAKTDEKKEILIKGVRLEVKTLLKAGNIAQSKVYDQPSKWKARYKEPIEKTMNCLVDDYKYYSTWTYENEEGYEVTIDDEQNRMAIYKEGKEVIEDLTLDKWKHLYVRYIPR